MQAVILAAGIGTRLKTKTDRIPKGLIEIGGNPLLEYSLKALLHNRISEVIMIVGHLHEDIKRRFGTRYHDLRIEYVHNPKYASTGSMYSLATAQDLIQDDIILLESDLLYEPRAMDILLNSQRKNALLVVGLSGSGDEVYICTKDDDQIVELGKYIPESSRKNAIGELAGISKFQPAFLECLFRQAQKDFKKGFFHYHYEECVFNTSLTTEPVYAVLGNDLAWIEIDTEADLKRAQEQVYPIMMERTKQKRGSG